MSTASCTLFDRGFVQSLLVLKRFLVRGLVFVPVTGLIRIGVLLQFLLRYEGKLACISRDDLQCCDERISNGLVPLTPFDLSHETNFLLISLDIRGLCEFLT